MSKVIGISPRSFPTPDGATAIMLAVLVQRLEGTFKVYAAIVSENSRLDPNYEQVIPFVQGSGAPLRFVEAKINFPSLQEKDYAG